MSCRVQERRGSAPFAILVRTFPVCAGNPGGGSLRCGFIRFGCLGAGDCGLRTGVLRIEMPIHDTACSRYEASRMGISMRTTGCSLRSSSPSGCMTRASWSGTLTYVTRDDTRRCGGSSQAVRAMRS